MKDEQLIRSLIDFVLDVYPDWLEFVRKTKDRGSFDFYKDKPQVIQLAQNYFNKARLDGFEAAMDTLNEAQGKFIIDPAAMAWLKNERHKFAHELTKSVTNPHTPPQEQK